MRQLREHRVAVRVVGYPSRSQPPGFDVLCDSCGLVAATWTTTPRELTIAHDRATAHVELHRAAVVVGRPLAAVIR